MAGKECEGRKKSVLKSGREWGHENVQEVLSGEDLESGAEPGAGQALEVEKHERGAGVAGRVSLPESPKGIWKVMGSRRRWKKGSGRLGRQVGKAAWAVL